MSVENPRDYTHTHTHTHTHTELELINSSTLEDTQLTHKNQLRLFTPTMNDPKMKLRKQFYLQ